MFALSLSVFQNRIKLSTFILNRLRELLVYSKRCVFEPCRLIKNHTQVFMVQTSCDYYLSRSIVVTCLFPKRWTFPISILCSIPSFSNINVSNFLSTSSVDYSAKFVKMRLFFMKRHCKSITMIPEALWSRCWLESVIYWCFPTLSWILRHECAGVNMPFFHFTHKDKEFQWKCLHNINYTEQMNLANEKCHLCQIKDSDEMIQHLFF